MKPLLFGKYCLLERVSVGGMAEVFRAKPFDAPDFRGYLALKRILPHLAEDDEFIKMFVDEAKLTVQLGHPSIVRIYELGQFQNSYYILMEFISGKDLLALQKTMRKQRDVIPVDMAMFIAREMARGLHFAHHKRDPDGNPLNIIHRDVSPQNVLVDYRGSVKVIDFGIAKAAVQSTRTQVGVLKGKMGYMSPEQVRGEVLDYRSDVFAIGTVLWEMLTNRRLFHAENEFETMQKVREAKADPPSTKSPHIPAEVDAIVMGALTRDPEQRYDSAGAFADAIDGWLAARPFGAEDLSVWMRTIYADDLEAERTKRDEFAKIVTPDDVRRIQEELDEAPPKADPQPKPPAPAEEGLEDWTRPEEIPPDATDAEDEGLWVGGVGPDEGQDIGEFADQHTVVQAGGFDASEIVDDELDTFEAPSLKAAALSPLPAIEFAPVVQQHAISAFPSEDTNTGRPPAGAPRSVYVFVALSILLLILGVGSIAAVLVLDEPAAVAAGSISVNVAPPTELEILVDGNLVGNVSPYELPGLTPGPHVVEVKKADFTPFRQTVEVAPNGVARLDVQLEAIQTPSGFVVLRLPDERDGMAVYVDGERQVVEAGKNPTFELPAGRHLLEVLQKGYRPWSNISELEPGLRREELVKLVPALLSLEVVVDPASSIRIGNEKVGRGTSTATGISPTEIHALSVSYRGLGVSNWKSYIAFPDIGKGTITVDFDQPTPPVRRQSDFGWLQASTGDDWWEVLIDDVETGFATPIDARSKLPIVKGKHKLTFRRGAKTVDRDITIDAGETLIFSETVDFAWAGADN